MTNFLIASGMLVLVGVVVVPRFRRGKSGVEEIDSTNLDRPLDVEKGRAASEAAAGKAHHNKLSDAEQTAVEEFHAFVEEIRSGEFPIVRQTKRRYVRRDIGRRIAAIDRHMRSYVAARRVFDEDPLTAPLPTLDGAAPVLSSMPKSLPTWELDSFTGEWNASMFGGAR